MDVWLDVIGIGEDGWDGLAPDARAALQRAELIIGGQRHMGLIPDLPGERMVWPSPFSTLREEIGAYRGRQVAVLVTGDPLWFSAGGHLARLFDPGEMRFHPALSSFQLAAARMAWSLADVETLTVHGRPVEQILPWIGSGQRLLLLTRDAGTPAEVAELLRARGFGRSAMTVLGALGGPEESRIDGVAESWDAVAPEFHVLAVDCQAEAGSAPLPRWGLPDDAFVHDGKMTKREMRVLTLAALAPRPGERLWDIGTGCGSVAVEWMRAARDMEAVGIDPSAARLEMAGRNAKALGAPRLKLVQGRAPEALAGLDAPDAVFVGGGLSDDVVDAALRALRPFGRLVANAVTLESEARLAALQAAHGGELIRVQVARAEAVGGFRGWRAAMPVTQWVMQR